MTHEQYFSLGCCRSCIHARGMRRQSISDRTDRSDGHGTAPHGTSADDTTDAGADNAPTSDGSDNTANDQRNRNLDRTLARTPWRDGRADAPHSNGYVDIRDRRVERSGGRRHHCDQCHHRLDCRQRGHHDLDPRGANTVGVEHDHDDGHSAVLARGNQQHGDVGHGRELSYSRLQRQCIVPGANHCDQQLHGGAGEAVKQ